jgi:hypothetical protein
MIYLTGAYRKSQVAALVDLGVGVMLQPGSGYAKSMATAGFRCWAADNGCFAQGDAFNLEKFYAWLERVPRDGLLFATAPDVFPDHAATLVRSVPVLAEMRRRGFPVAFVAQNHAVSETLPWALFDCLFIGGEDHWKLSPGTALLVHEAKQRGKWVHMGRVNSEKRLRYAAMIGCDSADGTYLKYRNRAGDGVSDLVRWLRQSLLPFHTIPTWS